MDDRPDRMTFYWSVRQVACVPRQEAESDTFSCKLRADKGAKPCQIASLMSNAIRWISFSLSSAFSYLLLPKV